MLRDVLGTFLDVPPDHIELGFTFTHWRITARQGSKFDSLARKKPPA
ncbi:hypothetical protein LRS73_17855 [Methylobacterium currus]|nr:hypothetical protein [Methylobacterium currus]UHC14420.1 hypothetical protein LRS73_17855 [Methylobacterium currus]